jgi:hypothetical protein
MGERTPRTIAAVRAGCVSWETETECAFPQCDCTLFPASTIAAIAAADAHDAAQPAGVTITDEMVESAVSAFDSESHPSFRHNMRAALEAALPRGCVSPDSGNAVAANQTPFRETQPTPPSSAEAAVAEAADGLKFALKGDCRVSRDDPHWYAWEMLRDLAAALVRLHGGERG